MKEQGNVTNKRFNDFFPEPVSISKRLNKYECIFYYLLCMKTYTD